MKAIPIRLCLTEKAIHLVLVSLFVILPGCIPVFAQPREIHLWEGTSVREKGVTILPFIATENRFNGTAIIICPGGSYSWLDYETEGLDVARWLQKEGISAFVLRYRVQGIFEYVTHSRALFGGHQHPDMLEDIQRALQYIREHATDFSINPHLLGVMGFSAGGHLAMSSAVYHTTDFLCRIGIHHQVSLCPDFVVPIYPVVSMSHPDTHKRSRRALLGEWGKHKRKLRDSLSLERHIPTDCPPVFLVNCKDDPVVKYHNSELLDSALTAKGIPHRYIQYHTGGHGFGASDHKGSPESRQWRKEFIQWLKELIGNKDDE